MSAHVHQEQMEWLELLEPQQDSLGLLRPPWWFEDERPHRDGRAQRRERTPASSRARSVRRKTVERLVADGVLYVEKKLGANPSRRQDKESSRSRIHERFLPERL